MARVEEQPLDRKGPDLATTRLHYLLLILILAASALIQLTVVSRTVMDTPLRSDGRDYFSYAYNLAESGIYSRMPTWDPESNVRNPKADSLRPPGYSLFLLALGKPEPSDAFLHRISLAQGFLGIISVWLAFLVARLMCGPSWALLAAALTAVTPHLATISTNVLSESLFLFTLLSSVYALIRAVQTSKLGWYAVAGLAWGLCTLVRSTTILFPLVLLSFVYLHRQGRRYRRGLLIGLVGFSTAMAPWVIRNQFVGPDDSGPSLLVLTLAHGSYPGFMYLGLPQSFGFPYRFDPDMERITRDIPSVLSHIASQFASHPVTYLKWYALGKPYYFLAWGNVQGWDILIHPVLHSPFLEDRLFVQLRQLAFILHWPLMILGMLGMLLALAQPGLLKLREPEAVASVLVAMVVGYAVCFHMIAAPYPRYGIPFRPLIYALSMLPVQRAWSFLKSDKGWRSGAW